MLSYQDFITPEVKSRKRLLTSTPINRGYAGIIIDLFKCRRNITPEVKLIWNKQNTAKSDIKHG